MSRHGSRKALLRTSALASALTLMLSATTAVAQERNFNFDIPPESLSKALRDYGQAAGRQLIFTEDLVAGRDAAAVRGALTAQAALSRLLDGSGLVGKATPTGAILIVKGGPPAVTRAGAVAQEADATKASDRSTSLEQLIVTAPRKAATARIEEFKAPNLINVQSAEQIAKFPDFDAAEAIARVPGVSLTGDTGEGRFVNIRGIDNNLNGTTFGGVVLLNTQPQGTLFGSGRGVELDTIPVGSVDRIIVTKTGLPSHEAEGLGGSIELSPRSATAISRPLFAEVALGGGYEALRPNWSPRRAEIVVGGRFGLPGLASNGGFISKSEPFSFVITASENDDRRAIDDIEPFYAVDAGFTAPGVARADKVLDSINFRRYNYHRRRFGVGEDFEFQPNDNNRFYLRANVAGYIESVNNQQFHYTNLEFDPNGNFLTPTGAADPATGQVDPATVLVDPAHKNSFLAPAAGTQLSQRSEEETHRNTVVAIGAVSEVHQFTLDYQVAYSRATFSKGHDINPVFNGPSASLSYDNITDPRYPKFTVLNGVDVHDPAQYSLVQLFTLHDHSVDYEWSGQGSVSFPVHLIGDDGRLKFGVKARLRNKIDTPVTQIFATPPLPLTSVLGQGPFTNFYAGRYNVGFNVDAAKFAEFFRQNQGLFTENTVVGATLSAAAFFRAREDIYAGYGQYETTIGPWGVLAGVRVESTNATYAGNVISTDANGAPTITPTSRDHNYVNAFPTLQLRYQINPEMVLRATYSTGIGRPGFTQIAPSTQIQLAVFPASVTTGNPDLRPITGNNLDVSFDYNLPNSGVLQFGVFDKEISDYVVGRSVFGTFPGVTGQAFITTFVNAPSSYARGLEASYTQTFKSLPQPFDGLGVNGNLTLVDSRIELRAGEHHLLPATAKVTANASIFYAAHGLDIQLSVQDVGQSLSTIGASAETDVFQAERFTMDLTSSYALRRNVQIYFNAKNLLNTPLRFNEGRSDRPIQREFYDVTLETGIRAQF